jgi:hypothetical protein
MKTKRASQHGSLHPVKTGASAFLLLAALVASSCGGSHRAATSRTDTTQQTETIQTDTARQAATSQTGGAKYSHLAFVSASSGNVSQISDLAVTSALADGSGGWFVSGDFGLARMLPDGKIDSSWGTSESRGFAGSGLTGSGSRLFLLASRITAVSAPSTVPGVNGETPTRVSVVEAFDAETGARLWESPAFSPSASRLEVSSTHVYVGGAFTSVGNADRQGLAALDAETGKLLDWRIPPLQTDAPGDSLSANVSVLTLAGSRLYVGGFFSSIGGKQRNGLAAVDPSTGALLPWKPPKTVVSAYFPIQIVVTGDQLLVVGDDGFAAVSLSSGRELAWRSKLVGTATRLTVDGSLLYLGGNIHNGFNKVGGQVAVSGGPQAQPGLEKPSRGVRFNLAALNLETQHFTSWAPNLGFEYVDVGQIVPSGEQVLVIGAYTDSIG